jgi:hypothetical protein
MLVVASRSMGVRVPPVRISVHSEQRLACERLHSNARERLCGLIYVHDRPLVHRATPTPGQGAAAARERLRVNLQHGLG